MPRTDRPVLDRPQAGGTTRLTDTAPPYAGDEENACQNY